VEEIIPIFGVLEALLSDRETNLLSFLMKDICKMMGIEKLNTTASHPQCNGAVEMLNRTLKTMLRKHAAKCLAYSGISTSAVFCGLTTTHPTVQQGKNRHFYYLVLTVGL